MDLVSQLLERLEEDAIPSIRRTAQHSTACLDQLSRTIPLNVDQESMRKQYPLDKLPKSTK